MVTLNSNRAINAIKGFAFSPQTLMGGLGSTFGGMAIGGGLGYLASNPENRDQSILKGSLWGATIGGMGYAIPKGIGKVMQAPEGKKMGAAIEVLADLFGD